MKSLYCILFLLLAFSCQRDTASELPKKPLAYIVSSGSRKIDVLELQGFKVKKSYLLGNDASRFPRGPALSANHTIIALANPAYNFGKGHLDLHGNNFIGGITLFDLQSEKLIRRFDVPQANYNAVFSPQANEIWTTGVSHSGGVYVYDFGGKLLKKIPLDPDPTQIIISEDRQYAVVCSQESTFLQMIDLKSKAVVKKIKVDLAPTNVWKGSGNMALVSNEYRKSINFVDMSKFEVVDYIDLDFAPGALAYNTLTNELWICDETNERLVIYKKTNAVWKAEASIKRANNKPVMVQFYEGGKMALVLNHGSNSVSQMSALEDRQMINQIPVGESPSGMVILE